MDKPSKEDGAILRRALTIYEGHVRGIIRGKRERKADPGDWVDELTQVQALMRRLSKGRS